MRIQIRGNIPDAQAVLRTYVERRLAFALGRLDRRVRGVIVRFSDVGGHHASGAKRCHVSVDVAGGRPVNVECTAVDYFAAAAHAIHSAAQCVSRELDRRASTLISARHAPLLHG